MERKSSPSTAPGRMMLTTLRDGFDVADTELS